MIAKDVDNDIEHVQTCLLLLQNLLCAINYNGSIRMICSLVSKWAAGTQKSFFNIAWSSRRPKSQLNHCHSE